MPAMKLFKPACLIILIFLSACNSFKYLAVPVDYNPKFSFKPDTTTILLINQFDFSKLNANTKRRLDALKSGAFASIKSAQNQLSLLPHVHVINLADSVMLKINPDSIKYLASQYHSDYVLALSHFSADIVLSDVQSSVAYYNSVVAVSFELYESNGIYSKKLHGAANDPQSSGSYPGFIASLVIHPTVGGNKGAINSTAEHAAQNALQDYFPYTITHNRPLYNDDVLQPLVAQILAGNFDKAYTLSQPFLQDKDPKLASKAAYNLAVVYEAQGDIDIAVNMAQLSMDKNKNAFAATLLEDLKAE